MAAFNLPETFSNFKDDMEQTDNDGTLQIYSYKHCDNKSSNELKKCRGVVYNGQTPLFRSIGFTQEMNKEEWSSYIKEVKKDLTFYHAVEGTLLRVFYANSKWYVSTHRKLDAFRSRWGSSSSFGQLFEEVLGRVGMTIATLTDTLDKNHVYLFLLSSTPSTRMVCNAPGETYVLHVGTLLNGETYTTDYPVDRIATPVCLSLTAEQVGDYVETLDPLVYQGVIAFSPTGEHIKIVNTKYQIYSQVRGNEPSIMFRYLKIRNNVAYNRMMFELYPEHKTGFVSYENSIVKIAKTIHTAYINRFVNKQQVVVTPEEYRIVKECHSFHMKDREHNKVTLTLVMSILSMPQYTATLNGLVKKLKTA